MDVLWRRQHRDTRTAQKKVWVIKSSGSTSRTKLKTESDNWHCPKCSSHQDHEVEVHSLGLWRQKVKSWSSASLTRRPPQPQSPWDYLLNRRGRSRLLFAEDNIYICIPSLLLGGHTYLLEGRRASFPGSPLSLGSLRNRLVPMGRWLRAWGGGAKLIISGPTRLHIYIAMVGHVRTWRHVNI